MLFGSALLLFADPKQSIQSVLQQRYRQKQKVMRSQCYAYSAGKDLAAFAKDWRMSAAFSTLKLCALIA